MHAAHSTTGKHATGEHAASRLAGTGHHHDHPFRREPLDDDGTASPQAILPCDQSLTWLNCTGTTKSRAGSNSLARTLLHFHDFRLKRNGDFEESKGDYRFESRTRADAKALARDFSALGLDSKGAGSTPLARRLEAAVRDELLSTAAAQTAEDYNLEAETWIGAAPKQGVWYDMTAGLSCLLRHARPQLAGCTRPRAALVVGHHDAPGHESRNAVGLQPRDAVARLLVGRGTRTGSITVRVGKNRRIYVSSKTKKERT